MILDYRVNGNTGLETIRLLNQQSVMLDEHLILRHGPPGFAAAAVLAASVAEQELDSRRDSLNQAGELAYGRDHGVMHYVRSLFHSVKRAAEQFIGADNLQTRPIHSVIHRRIHAFHLRTY